MKNEQNVGNRGATSIWYGGNDVVWVWRSSSVIIVISIFSVYEQIACTPKKRPTTMTAVNEVDDTDGNVDVGQHARDGFGGT